MTWTGGCDLDLVGILQDAQGTRCDKDLAYVHALLNLLSNYPVVPGAGIGGYAMDSSQMQPYVYEPSRWPDAVRILLLEPNE